MAIESYERERGKYEAKVLQFQTEMERTQSDIDDFDRVVEGTLENVEQARRNDRYGANVKSAIDRMTEWQDICRYYGFGAVANNAIGSHFGNVNHGGDAGGAYGIGAGTVGIGAGIGAAAGAYGLAGAIGVASTGTAIGTLSGAAATSASLAWLGGGALAAGGLGMIGGVAALTGIGLIPLAGAGIFAGVLYKRRNRKRADAIEQEVLQKIGEMDQARQGLDRATEHLSMLGNALRRNSAEIRFLNNRGLGAAIEAGANDQVAQEAKSLILAIHRAIKEVQDLWNGGS